MILIPIPLAVWNWIVIIVLIFLAVGGVVGAVAAAPWIPLVVWGLWGLWLIFRTARKRKVQRMEAERQMEREARRQAVWQKVTWPYRSSRRALSGAATYRQPSVVKDEAPVPPATPLIPAWVAVPCASVAAEPPRQLDVEGVEVDVAEHPEGLSRALAAKPAGLPSRTSLNPYR